MKSFGRVCWTMFFLLLSVFVWAEDPFTVTFIHVNDTHSHFDPALVKLSLLLEKQEKPQIVYAQLGGFAQVANVIASLKAKETNPVVLHAGDFFQGTLYFTQSLGLADAEFWNLVGLDVATLGNHEFDKGPTILRENLLKKAQFPIVSTNVDWTGEQTLASVPALPFFIKTIAGEQVGFIGATTVTTPYISSPGPNLRFNNPAEVLQKAVDQLTARGVNKIVAITHLGYEEDMALASQVSGIDVIVGGHSHTLLGDWQQFGLPSRGAYPTVIKDKKGSTVLIVQAWEWAKVVGDLHVSFDRQGQVTSWKAAPVVVVGDELFRLDGVPDPSGTPKRVQIESRSGTVQLEEYDGKAYQPVNAALAAYYQPIWQEVHDYLVTSPQFKVTSAEPKAKALTERFAGRVKELKTQIAATVAEDLNRGLNQGPGPIVAEAMLAKTGVQIALTNPGGIRTNLNQGNLTVADVYELIPFGNTLVTMTVKGSELLSALEDGVDNSLGTYGASPDNPLIYSAGIRFQVDTKAPRGSRVLNVLVRQKDGRYSPLEKNLSYGLVVNNFMAAGGDRYDTLKIVPNKVDTGFVDAEVLLDFVKGKTLVKPEATVTVVR